ncbi:MAG: GNAT family N-acetyltransferase [Novosphingobium sp. 16-62-11]|nr:MAG: GNAT family N-acetyltransferase [Novosphingobium sp. 16-62-11]
MAVQDVVQIVMRDMTGADIAAVADLCFEQQWPHREEDLQTLLSIGSGLVAEIDGRIVGTIMAWRFGETFATLGVVIVAVAHQGRGLGRQLASAMIERLGDRTVLLNATEEGRPLYSRLGFAEIDTICQHQALAPGQTLVPLRAGERVRPMGAADAEALAALYNSATGMDRRILLETVLAEGSTVVLCHEHEQKGFAVLRRFGRGWVIGPVVAPDVTGAKALIAHWLGMQSGSFCRIDVPEESRLGTWLEDIGMPQVDRVTRMARGTAPVPGDAAKVFALAAQALG